MPPVSVPTNDPRLRIDVDNIPVANGRDLGMIPYHESSSADNTPELNSFFSTYGTGTDKKNRYRVELDGSSYHFTSSLNSSTVLQTSNLLGGSLTGAGGISPELGTAQYQYQSALTRLTYDGSYTAGKAFLTVLGQGMRISDLVLQGGSASTYAGIPSNYDNLLDYGVYIPSSTAPFDLGQTTGKVHGINLGLGGFKTGVRLGTIGGNGTGEHSDYFTYPGVIWAGSCGTVFHLTSIQNVVTHIGTLHCQGCGRGIYLEAGGCNTTINNLYFGEISSSTAYITPRAVIEIGGNPYSYNANKLNINFLHIDGSVIKTPILRSNGPGAGGTGSDIINIYGASIPPAYPSGSLQGSAAAFTFRGGRVYNLYGVSYLQEGMFAVAEEGNGPPIINLYGCTMGPKIDGGGAVIGYHDKDLLVDTTKSLAVGTGTAYINHINTNRFGNGAAYDNWPTYTGSERYVDGVRND